MNIDTKSILEEMALLTWGEDWKTTLKNGSVRERWTDADVFALLCDFERNIREEIEEKNRQEKQIILEYAKRGNTKLTEETAERLAIAIENLLKYMVHVEIQAEESKRKFRRKIEKTKTYGIFGDDGEEEILGDDDEVVR